MVTALCITDWISVAVFAVIFIAWLRDHARR